MPGAKSFSLAIDPARTRLLAGDADHKSGGDRAKLVTRQWNSRMEAGLREGCSVAQLLRRRSHLEKAARHLERHQSRSQDDLRSPVVCLPRLSSGALNTASIPAPRRLRFHAMSSRRGIGRDHVRVGPRYERRDVASTTPRAGRTPFDSPKTILASCSSIPMQAVHARGRTSRIMCASPHEITSWLHPILPAQGGCQCRR
jgi:hypothetical protein